MSEEKFTFGFKLIRKESKSGQLFNEFGIKMTCTTPGHNKFYNMFIRDPGTILIEYGKIGTAGIRSLRKVPHGHAMSFVKAKEREQLKKGYVRINN